MTTLAGILGVSRQSLYVHQQRARAMLAQARLPTPGVVTVRACWRCGIRPKLDPGDGVFEGLHLLIHWGLPYASSAAISSSDQR